MQLEPFPPQSKVWVYQSSRPFNDDEINKLNIQIEVFTKQWTAHNHQLQAFGKVLEDRFIFLLVDESTNEASGCSIDKSVHFMKEIEQMYQVELFNRMLATYRKNDMLYTMHISEIKEKLKSEEIAKDTLFYNTLVQTKDEFELQFIQPLNSSYLFQFV